MVKRLPFYCWFNWVGPVVGTEGCCESNFWGDFTGDQGARLPKVCQFQIDFGARPQNEFGAWPQNEFGACQAPKQVSGLAPNWVWGLTGPKLSFGPDRPQIEFRAWPQIEFGARWSMNCFKRMIYMLLFIYNILWRVEEANHAYFLIRFIFLKTFKAE